MNCPKCKLTNATCVCEQLGLVSLSSDIVIIRHYKEGLKSSNSARILQLSSRNVKILDYGRLGEEPLKDIDFTECALLFPIEEGQQIYQSMTPPKTILVLDGSWKHARRMYRRLSKVHALPLIEVSPSSPPLPRIRQPSIEYGMSTMEACIQALRKFNSGAVIDTLVSNYHVWLDQVRLNTGIRDKLQPGSSFKIARKRQDIIDGKIIPPR